MQKVNRVLDANLNRAREGLRVLEDTARFVWNSPGLFRSLRDMRHELDRVTRAAYPRLVEARDSVRDRGRTAPETGRRDWAGLVVSNFRRSQEALRVLEEYGKVISPGAATRFKKIRFELYSAEKAVAEKFLEN
jgi:thiamine-phosphate pyrophosphorylase